MPRGKVVTITNLFNMSIDSGSHQSFYSFNGQANAIQNGASVTVPTMGSMMVINPSKYLCLNPLLSNSSIGQFNLQITISSFTNQFPFSIQPQGVIMAINSGYFVTELGSSSIFTAVLDRQIVLDTKSQDEHHSVIDEELYKRSVGGAMHKGSAGIAKMARMKGRPKGHKSGSSASEESAMNVSGLKKLLGKKKK